MHFPLGSSVEVPYLTPRPVCDMPPSAIDGLLSEISSLAATVESLSVMNLSGVSAEDARQQAADVVQGHLAVERERPRHNRAAAAVV